ncbi:MAG TPA: TonB-dependent receptor, partial [Bacteroidia bacterium]|nr:TonB-dependent receptor [Bacteroidia bacterium]
NAQGVPTLINQSLYMQYKSVNDQKRFSFNTVYNTAFNENIGFQAGLRYQLETSENYEQVADLLGGKYWVDVNQYAQLSYPDSSAAAQNNLNNPNQLCTVGSKYGYDYITVQHNATAWVQPQFHFKHVDFFVAAELKFTSFWRNGLFRNGLFPDSSYGKSPMQNFINYAVKGGITYKIDGRNFLYANGAYLTAAPLIGHAYVSAQTREQVAPGLGSETVFSGEAGYMYKSPIIKLRASFFATQFNNQTKTISFYNDDLATFVNYTLTNVNTRHMGGELAFEAKLYKGFSISAVGTYAQAIYTNRAFATVTNDNSSSVIESGQTVYWKNYNVGGAPQLATTVGLSYHSPQAWYVDLYFNYYGNNFVTMNPARLTTEAVTNLDPSSPLWQQIIAQEKLPGAFTMDLFAGYSWLMNNQFAKMKKYKYYLVFGLNVTNINNNRNFITSGYEQYNFDFKTQNLGYYPNKYVYAYGANYLFTVAFRMN